MNGFALRLVLKQRQTRTRKWAIFPCLLSLIETLGELEELAEAMQTQDAVEGLYYFRESSPAPECLDEAI